jgi:hypothetical protein
VPHEGRIAIVTARWRGWRWTLRRQRDASHADENACSGRRSRVVLAPRPWRQADGTIDRRRWQKRPLTGESTKQAVKPLRGESRDVSAVPVVLPPCFLLHGDYGRSRRPAFPAPSSRKLGDSRILALGGKSIAVEGCGETSPALAHSFWPWWLVVAIPTAETGCNPGYEGKRAWRVRIFLP